MQNVITNGSGESRWVGPAVLLAVGAAILVAALGGDLDRYLPITIGLVTLAAFALTREYGFAVATGIVGGVGVAIVLAVNVVQPTETGQAFLLSLSGGFLSVWLLGLLARPAERNPWPLVPGFVLGSIGLSMVSRTPAIADVAMVGVGILILAAGGLMLIRGRG